MYIYMLRGRLIMKNVVQRLLDSDESSYSISKNTGVYASVIQRLRTKEQSIGESKLDNIEKMYHYQISKELSNALDAQRYSQYRTIVNEIKNSEDFETKYKSLLRMNSNISMAMRSMWRSAGYSEERGNSESALIYKMISLLNLDNGVNIEKTNISGVFQKNKSIKYLCVFKKPLETTPFINDNVSLLEIKNLDINSDVSSYTIYFSNDINDMMYLSEFNPIKHKVTVQCIIDQIDDNKEVI